MTATRAVLGVDFGTSHTVAAVRMPDGRVESLLFDASPLLPSAVFAQADGRLLVGHDALRGSLVEPGRLEPHPKRRIDDGALLLGEVETAVVDAVGAVLARVAEAARRVLGGPPGSVVLTHPAAWGAPRRDVLLAAAARGGLGGDVRLLAEPVAAALYFTETLGNRVDAGATLVVYDLGGGTCDVSALRRRADGGWDVVAAAGLDDVGGVDLDAAIVDWLATHAGAGVTGSGGTGLVERRRRQLVRQEARAAKEQLSRVATAPIVLPELDRDLHLTRDEFDGLARPWLERTVALTTSTLFAGGVAADRLAGLFLVGGSSRIPLVATMLHRALGVAPTVIDHPELVVAHGSLGAPPRQRPAPPPDDGAGLASPEPPAAAAVPADPAPPRASRRQWAAVLLIGALVGAITTAYPLVAGYDTGLLPPWTDRYAWQLLPLAGLLAGLWTRRRGAALAAQAASGVAAGLVGLAMERADQNIFDEPWDIPVDFYYWEHYPDVWFVTLLGGFVSAGLVVEAALAATARLRSRGVAIAAVTLAGALVNLLLTWLVDWDFRPAVTRVTIDTIFAYPVLLAVAWVAARR